MARENFMKWGAKAILTGLIFPGLLVFVGWFYTFVSDTKAEISTLKQKQKTEYEALTNSISDIKTDVRDIRSYLMPHKK